MRFGALRGQAGRFVRLPIGIMPCLKPQPDAGAAADLQPGSFRSGPPGLPRVRNNQESPVTMAKSQKRSSREIRKPKAAKAKPATVTPLVPSFPVSNLLQKPKGKL